MDGEKRVNLETEADSAAVDEALRIAEKNLRAMMKSGKGLARERLKKLLPIIAELQRRGFSYKEIHARMLESLDVSMNSMVEAVKEYKKTLPPQNNKPAGQTITATGFEAQSLPSSRT